MDARIQRRMDELTGGRFSDQESELVARQAVIALARMDRPDLTDPGANYEALSSHLSEATNTLNTAVAHLQQARTLVRLLPLDQYPEVRTGPDPLISAIADRASEALVLEKRVEDAYNVLEEAARIDAMAADADAALDWARDESMLRAGLSPHER